MSCDQKPTLHRRDCTANPAKNSSQAARLVGVGFRLWLSGFRSSDVSYWENAWQLYSSVLGPHPASAAINELSGWVRAVATSANREIEVLPDTCPGFCRDECLAVAMIAACQHKTCPAMRACAFALVENSCVEDVVTRSECFASTMLGVNQVLSPDYIVNTAALDLEPPTEYVQ